MSEKKQVIKNIIFNLLKKKLSLFNIKKIHQFDNDFDLLNNEIYDSLDYMNIAVNLEKKKMGLDLSLNQNRFPKSLNDFYKITKQNDKYLRNLNKSKKINLGKIFKYLKIKKNNNVLVHSSFMKLANYKINEEFFLKELQNTIGKKGTIFVVGVNFKEYFSNKFDKKKTVPHNEFGILSKLIFYLNKSIRSSNPFDSLIGIGKYSNICRKNNFCSYDDESPWANLVKLKTKILLADVDFFYCSYLHRIEYEMKVPYRTIKSFKRKYGEYALYARKRKKLFLHYNKILLDEKLKRDINFYNFNDINFYSTSCFVLNKNVSRLVLKNKNYFMMK